MSIYLKSINPINITWGTGEDLTIILDTNILSYMLIPDTKQQIDNFLKQEKQLVHLIKCNLVHTVSSVSIYECLQGKNDALYINLFDTLKCYEVDIDVQYIAAKLKLFYTKHGIKINDIPDLYISATALINAGSILTANQDDYPDILFKEIGTRQIIYKEKNRTKGVMLYLLRPDYIKARETGFINVIENKQFKYE